MASKSLSEVSSRERALVDAVVTGCVVTCSKLTMEQLAATESPRYTIRAELIRELVLGRNGDRLDPLGVRIHGARITGTLDLTHVPAAVGIELRGCYFERAVYLTSARLPWLTLSASHLPALDGDGLRVAGDVLLCDGFTATGQGADGAVRLLGAHISGQLNLNGARLTNDAGPALIGDGLHVYGDVFGGGFIATGHGELGAVRLPGAHISGQLNLNSAELTNQAGPALIGDGLHVDGGLVLAEGFTATGHCERGAVRLPGAHISGQLNLDGAELINNAGPALIGDHLQVNGGVFLDGFTATGYGDDGAVRLPDAHIKGQLNLDGAELTNYTGPALIGDHLQVESDMFAEGFTATGHSTDSAVRLSDARISGQLNLNGAKLTNQAGRALIGDHLHVGSDMFAEGFTATGHSTDGTVRLPDAQISGQLDLNNATLTNPAGPVLDLEDAETKHLFLPAHVICPHGTASRSMCAAPERRLALSGLVYTSLHTVGWHEWLHLIIHHTNDYRPQPYQQLATVLKATGRESTARNVLIAQQQDLHDRGELGGRLIKGAHRLWGILAGYGYRSGRIVIALLVVLLVAAGLGVAAGHTSLRPGHYVAAHTTQTDGPGSPCSLFEQISLGIDHSLPLVTTGVGDRCDVDTSSPTGVVFTAATWILQCLVWALAILVVASYLRLTRKPT
ncbi:MAG TPA: hypothetical protein VJT72_07190 [Pseudonocardiaceae bacterium]|nr:hypothetical protein [Pseudonocardiaceae bacterium]